MIFVNLRGVPLFSACVNVVCFCEEKQTPRWYWDSPVWIMKLKYLLLDLLIFRSVTLNMKPVSVLSVWSSWSNFLCFTGVAIFLRRFSDLLCVIYRGRYSNPLIFLNGSQVFVIWYMQGVIKCRTLKSILWETGSKCRVYDWCDVFYFLCFCWNSSRTFWISCNLSMVCLGSLLNKTLR